VFCIKTVPDTPTVLAGGILLPRELDPRISGIFYYFEEHTNIASGRTMGRKIGVVQEILVKKHLLNSVRILDAITYEPRIPGRSGASHKVEFVFFQPIVAAELGVGDEVKLSSRPTFAIRLVGLDVERGMAKITWTFGNERGTTTLLEGRFAPGKLQATLLNSPFRFRFSCVLTDKRARFALITLEKPCASIESKRVGAQRFSNSDALGSGIQTIEKAKQASLVAVDFDLKYNDGLLALQGRDSVRSYRSIVALGNGVHWTANDLAVLETYVDFTYHVEDAAIIRYADFVKKLANAAGAEFHPFFMSYFQGMTNTLPDAFKVTAADFRPMVPTKAPALIKVVENQIAQYTVISA
jgi:hypothetical protein